jgi:hypothetical protein
VAPPSEVALPAETMEPVTDVFAAAGLTPAADITKNESVLPGKPPDTSGDLVEGNHKATIITHDLDSQTKPLVTTQDQASSPSPSVSH